MSKIHCSFSASSLALLAFLLVSPAASAQMPPLFRQFVEKQQSLRSGHVVLREIQLSDGDTTSVGKQDVFFVTTPKDLRYLTLFTQTDRSNTYVKTAHSILTHFNSRWDGKTYTWYSYDSYEDPKFDINFLNTLLYDGAYGFPMAKFADCVFQRIPPQISSRNIRYRMTYLDDEVNHNRFLEYEFDRKNFHWVVSYGGTDYFHMEKMSQEIVILEQQLYDYIHPGILDTITFAFEELRRAYDRQEAEKRRKTDSLFRDSLAKLPAAGLLWTEELPTPKDSLFFMPPWQFPTLSGDTLRSEEITSRFLLIDMGYLSCHPCRLALRDLAALDTAYDESLLKTVSLNVYDKDTAKMGQLFRHFNFQGEVLCDFGNGEAVKLSRAMGISGNGYPQLYLVDMAGKRVVWSSLGWSEEFPRKIEEAIRRETE